jgi:hypothetical protein
VITKKEAHAYKYNRFQSTFGMSEVPEIFQNTRRFGFSWVHDLDIPQVVGLRVVVPVATPP